MEEPFYEKIKLFKLTIDFQPHAVHFVGFLDERVRGPADELQVDVIHLRPQTQDAHRRVPVARRLQVQQHPRLQI